MDTSPLTLFFLLMLLCARGEAWNLCRAKPEPKADLCVHGKIVDYCGRSVCARGPGERCGGSSNMNGTCGEGMHCICGACNGCSIFTFKCHSSDPTCK